MSSSRSRGGRNHRKHNLSRAVDATRASCSTYLSQRSCGRKTAKTLSGAGMGCCSRLVGKAAGVASSAALAKVRRKASCRGLAGDVRQRSGAQAGMPVPH